MFVNPVVTRPAGNVATGVRSPARCAFPSITAAINSINKRGLGPGARIVLTGATATAPAVFRKEVFPLTLPDGARVTTTDDPAFGGAGLNPARYVVRFTGAGAYGVHVNGGGLAGLTVRNQRSARATMMVICDEGTTVFDAVTFDGASPVSGQIRRGLHLWSGCDLTADRLRVRGHTGNGMVVADGAELALDQSKVHDNGGDGVVIRGEASLQGSEIAFNGDDGILVEGGSAGTFHNTDVRDNGGNGFEVHQSDVSFTSNKIHNNSRMTGWDEPQMLFVGPSDPAGVDYWTGSEFVKAYPVGTGPDCDDINSQPNQIHSYNTATDPVGSSEGSVGVYASAGAVVAADGNSWRTGDRSQNADQDASSFVDADTLCPAGGIILALDPAPGPPVQ